MQSALSQGGKAGKDLWSHHGDWLSCIHSNSPLSFAGLRPIFRGASVLDRASLVPPDGKESACNVGDSGLIPGFERSLEKSKQTHSSILVWKIPWTKEPGGLQSMGSQRVRHK